MPTPDAAPGWLRPSAVVHASQRTLIGPGGRAAGAKPPPPRPRRVRCRQRPPALHGQDRARPPPRPGDLAVDQQRARPDPRRPQLALAALVRDQEAPVGALEQEEGVAAGEQPRGCGRAWLGPDEVFVGAEQPRLADGRPHRGQRLAQRLERRDGRTRADPRPPGKRLGRRRSVAAQVAARELEARLARAHLGGRDDPDRRLPRALPADQDGAGRARVPEAVRIHAQSGARLLMADPLVAEGGARGSRRAPPPAAGPWRRPASCRARRRRRSHAATTNTLYRGPHSCTSDGSAQVAGSVARDPGVDRQHRRPGHAVLQPRPGRPLQRGRPRRKPLVERADLPPERQNLRSREVEPCRGASHDPPPGTACTAPSA